VSHARIGAWNHGDASMSLADELRRTQERALARMRELEPLVAEYEELRALLAQADDGRRRGGEAARNGAAGREARVLEAVRAEPGLTVAEIGARLGEAPTTLYRVVRNLTADGALVKRGRALFPA
jgi:DNA-binding MarR family transcriptional regulator